MNRIARALTAGLGTLALLAAGLGADEPKLQTVEVEGLSFQVPASWKFSKPASAMRKGQIRVEPTEGDKAPAELIIYIFPGGAGSVEANVARWQGQFKDESGKAPEVASKKLPGKGIEVTRVECAGRYVDPFSTAGPQPDFRLLGAIATTDQAGYFLKMVGPDKTMKAIADDFDAMIKTISVK